MTKYYFCTDDDSHCDRIKEFTDLVEAKKFFEKEKKECMADPEQYFGDDKEGWIEDQACPAIVLEEWNGPEDDEEYIGLIESWSPDLDDLEKEWANSPAD